MDQIINKAQLAELEKNSPRVRRDNYALNRGGAFDRVKLTDGTVVAVVEDLDKLNEETRKEIATVLPPPKSDPPAPAQPAAPATKTKTPPPAQ